MPDLGTYGVYVLGSYAVTFALFGALILRMLSRNAKARAALEKVENHG